MMIILRQIDLFVYFGVVTVVLAGILLILLRSLFRRMDVNPFTWHAINVKRVTDPIVLPVRAMLVSMRVDPIVAPVIVIVVFILIGFFVIQVVNGSLNTVAGILTAAHDAAFLVVGLSEDWQREGLGAVRAELAERAGLPILFARRGLRPGGLAPRSSLTRFTWSLQYAGSSS